MRTGLLVLAAAMSLQADLPAWFREAATATHPAYPPQAKSVVLFDEERVSVDETGKQTTTIRRAIKILTLEGKGHAQGMLGFDAKDSKVKDFKAWIIQPTGKTKEFTKKDYIEGAMADYELYSSYRFYGVNASKEVDPNGIFGFESTVEEKTVFTQFSYSFQSSQPHLLSRFQLTVPAGWRAEAKAYDGAPDKPSVEGNTYTWEARKLGFIDREPSAPRLRSMLPRIRVTLIPPTGANTGALPVFETWKDVSVWKSKLSDPQAELTDAIRTKAMILTAGKEGMAKLQAIAEFVQDIRYVAISTDISKGGGYVPHRADLVLKTAYGDCKDKANLMRTMLKALNVDSWMVSIWSGDPRWTREDWPSPQQFNHAILAVSVPSETKAQSALTHPELGRLMLFDPTDPFVSFGYLPDGEQGAFALVVAGERGSLIQTPKTAPAENHTDRQWDVTLSADGSLRGKLEERMTGQEAFDELASEKTLTRERYRKLIEARMSAAMTGASISSMSNRYDPASKTYSRTIEFEAPGYARIMQGKLWMLKSGPLSYDGVPNLNRAERTQPLILEPVSFTEGVTWRLPSTLKVDEVPGGDQLETALGKYQAEWIEEPGVVKMKRSIELSSQVVPVAEYKMARDFVLRFHGSQQQPIVLMTK